ncbi:hypothetical protein C8R47DRAFT_1134971 [Mycena vitilis]|nr:hypothetical protein C8R47DRAFT_1134971 [Mycena vitilis]
MSTNSSAHPFTMRSLPAESRAQRVQRVKYVHQLAPFLFHPILPIPFHFDSPQPRLDSPSVFPGTHAPALTNPRRLSGSASRRRPQHPHRACAMSSPTRQTQWRSAQTIRGGDGDGSYGAGDEVRTCLLPFSFSPFLHLSFSYFLPFSPTPLHPRPTPARFARTARLCRDETRCVGPASSASRLQAPPTVPVPGALDCWTRAARRTLCAGAVHRLGLNDASADGRIPHDFQSPGLGASVRRRPDVARK